MEILTKQNGNDTLFTKDRRKNCIDRFLRKREQSLPAVKAREPKADSLQLRSRQTVWTGEEMTMSWRIGFSAVLVWNVQHKKDVGEQMLFSSGRKPKKGRCVSASFSIAETNKEARAWKREKRMCWGQRRSGNC